MKTILLIITAITLISCKKEIITQQPTTPVKNCNCDKIVKIIQYTIIGDAQAKPDSPQSKPTNHATIYTVNECTNFNDWHEFKSKEVKYYKKIGDCY
jgi:hypothetical protein